MFEIGTSLAAARKGQSLTLSDAERMTCLRGRYITALEREDFDALPGRAYARAFLRTYSDTLGLDADRFVDEFDLRFPESQDEPEPVRLAPIGRRRNVRRSAVAAVGLMAAIAGLVAWTTTNGPSSLAPMTGHSAANAAGPRSQRHVGAVSHPAPPPVAMPSPLVISAIRGECWLLVRRGGSTGAVIYQGTLAQGTTIRFLPHVSVRFGAPWNVTVHRGRDVPQRLSATAPVDLSL